MDFNIGQANGKLVKLNCVSVNDGMKVYYIFVKKIMEVESYNDLRTVSITTDRSYIFSNIDNTLKAEIHTDENTYVFLKDKVELSFATEEELRDEMMKFVNDFEKTIK